MKISFEVHLQHYLDIYFFKFFFLSPIPVRINYSILSLSLSFLFKRIDKEIELSSFKPIYLFVIENKLVLFLIYSIFVSNFIILSSKIFIIKSVSFIPHTIFFWNFIFQIYIIKLWDKIYAVSLFHEKLWFVKLI